METQLEHQVFKVGPKEFAGNGSLGAMAKEDMDTFNELGDPRVVYAKTLIFERSVD